ncbi:MAG: tRNA (N6-isopentenyl adenosine(37)-C2)-methylthiotransferase MiaB [Candidatus Omnitrophota bacterium]
MKEDKKKVYLRSFGCQMNLRDSEVVAGLLKDSGFQLAGVPEKADILIFNTCAVRQHAEDKVWSEIGRFKKQGIPVIGLIGCMAQNYQDRVFERCPAVDFVVGPSDIHKIPGIIKKVSGDRCQATGKSLYEVKIWETEGGNRPEEIYHTGFYEDKEHSFVVISEGCSNFCSYCVVPYTRGRLRHRKHADILDEIKLALDKGIVKVTLLGQNVNAYQDGNIDFIKLLERVNSIAGLKEFSFITSHPKDADVELFKAMAACDKLKKYLHLPAQSGSDKILKLMNRGYTAKFYLALADNYRKIVDSPKLTTDIIVGFPTETEADFKHTYNLVKGVGFDTAYIFKYSPRPNTASLKLGDDVPKQEKERRHALILELQKKISRGKK